MKRNVSVGETVSCLAADHSKLSACDYSLSTGQTLMVCTLFDSDSLRIFGQLCCDVVTIAALRERGYSCRHRQTVAIARCLQGV